MSDYSDWSGQVTVNSLPMEQRARMYSMAKLVESAAKAPQNLHIGERRWGAPSGFPAMVESLPGGAVRATVNSLAVKSAARPIGSEADFADDAPTDAFGRQARLSNTFKEFAADTIYRKMLQVREYGPKVGGLSGATGIYRDRPPYSGSRSDRTQRGTSDIMSPRNRLAGIRGAPSDDGYSFPRQQLNAADTDDWLRDLADHPGRTCYQVHSGQTHAAWAGDEDEEEERIKSHAGLSCREAHGIGTGHWAWRQIAGRLYNKAQLQRRYANQLHR